MITLYDGKPVPKVIDFGVAKATEQKLTERTLFTQFGTMVGTLEYMSPEQAEMSALGVDTRGDIYSLGVLLYELLTGGTPLSPKRLKEAAYDEILRMIREEEPPTPSTRLSESGEALASISAQRKTEPAKLSKLIRGELDWIVMKTLEKDRNRRYETVNGLAADVRRYLNDEPVQAGAPSAAYRFRKYARRNRLALSTAAMVLAAMVVGTCVSTWQAVRATHAEGLAETRLTAEAEQRRRADDARAQAVAAGKLAEERFQLAKDAVAKYLQDVTEDDDLKRADFNKLRKRLLQSAVPFYQKLVEQKSGEAKLEAARGNAYHRLALLRAEMGESEAAVADYERTRAIYTRLAADFPTVPEYRQELANSHNNLGNRLAALGKSGEAEAEYRAAMTIKEKLTADYPTVSAYRRQLATNHNNLGKTLADLGKRGEAEGEYRDALTIQEKLAADFPTVPKYRRDLAVSHNNLGSLLDNLGQWGEAEGEYRAALTIQEKLAADSPSVPEYRQKLAIMHDNLGNMLKSIGKSGEAAYRTALTIQEKLAADFPTVPEYRQDLAKSQNNLGAVLADVGRRAEAEVAYSAALAIREKLAADFPTVPAYRQDLARSHNNLGALLAVLGRRGEAEGENRLALAVREKLAADFPTVPEYRQELARSHNNLGFFLAGVGQRAEAEAKHRAALAIREKLAADFPTVPKYRSDLAASHNNLGLLLAGLGQRGEAEAAHRTAVTIYEKLAADFPTVPDYRRDMAMNHLNLGTLLRSIGKSREAEAESHTALTIYEKLASDFPAVTDYQNELAGTLVNLAVGHSQSRQFAAALPLLEQARPRHQAALAASPEDPTYRQYYRNHLLVLATTRLGLGDHAQAAATADELAAFGYDPANAAYNAACFLCGCIPLAENDAKLVDAVREDLAQTYADRAMALLRQAAERGFKDAAHMKQDTDLDPLRTREDFKELIAELQGETKE